MVIFTEEVCSLNGVWGAKYSITTPGRSSTFVGFALNIQRRESELVLFPRVLLDKGDLKMRRGGSLFIEEALPPPPPFKKESRTKRRNASASSGSLSGPGNALRLRSAFAGFASVFHSYAFVTATPSPAQEETEVRSCSFWRPFRGVDRMVWFWPEAHLGAGVWRWNRRSLVGVVNVGLGLEHKGSQVR